MNISSSSSSSADYGRITGLASGLDIDGLVESMLSNDQARVDKAKQAKQTLEWQQEAYVDIIKDLKKFYEYFDIAKSSNMLSSSNYVSTKSELSGKGLEITTFPGAVTGKYSVKIESLAEAPKWQISASTGAKKNTTLADAGLGPANYKIEIGGETFTVEADSDITIGDLIDKLKNTKSNEGSKSLSSLVEINFSELTGKLTIEGKVTGETQVLKVTNDLLPDSGRVGVNYPGKDALVYITPPGSGEGQVEYRSSSNSFTIDNVLYKLTEAGKTVDFNVVKNSEDSYNKFKVFIDSYNSIVEKLNSKITEKKDYNYNPLTDTQKEEMKEDEVKKWEAKAKQGILSRDNSLSSILTALRSTLYETVEGAGLTLTDIGISTTPNYNDGGKLQIDEAKFKSAIENNSEAVQKLFTSSGETTSKKGIFTKFKDIIDKAVGYSGSLIEKAGYENTRWVSENTISKKITDKNTMIKNLLRNLEEKRESLYRKFSILETNLNSLNSQSSYLASQFSL